MRDSPFHKGSGTNLPVVEEVPVNVLSYPRVRGIPPPQHFFEILQSRVDAALCPPVSLQEEAQASAGPSNPAPCAARPRRAAAKKTYVIESEGSDSDADDSVEIVESDEDYDASD